MKREPHENIIIEWAIFKTKNGIQHRIPVARIHREEFNRIYDLTKAVDRWSSPGLDEIGVSNMSLFLVDDKYAHTGFECIGGLTEDSKKSGNP